MPLSAAALQLIMARTSKEVWLWLLVIDHPDLLLPVRLVRNNEDVTSNGEDYSKSDFALTLPVKGKARIAMPNVSREIGFKLMDMEGPATVDFQAVLASSLNTVELDFPGFVLRNVAWTAQVAEGELVRGADDEEPYPSVRVTPGGFPPWFA